MKVLDTDFLIAVLENDDIKEEIEHILASNETIATTVFNIQEILYGTMISGSKRNFEKTMEFVKSIKILEYKKENSIEASRIRYYLRKKGVPIGLMDTMIAAICISNAASIVTRNEKHFNSVPGLVVEKW